MGVKMTKALREKLRRQIMFALENPREGTEIQYCFEKDEQGQGVTTDFSWGQKRVYQDLPQQYGWWQIKHTQEHPDWIVLDPPYEALVIDGIIDFFAKAFLIHNKIGLLVSVPPFINMTAFQPYKETIMAEIVNAPIIKAGWGIMYGYDHNVLYAKLRSIWPSKSIKELKEEVSDFQTPYFAKRNQTIAEMITAAGVKKARQGEQEVRSLWDLFPTDDELLRIATDVKRFGIAADTTDKIKPIKLAQSLADFRQIIKDLAAEMLAACQNLDFEIDIDCFEEAIEEGVVSPADIGSTQSGVKRLIRYFRLARAKNYLRAIDTEEEARYRDHDRFYRDFKEGRFSAFSLVGLKQEDLDEGQSLSEMNASDREAAAARKLVRIFKEASIKNLRARLATGPETYPGQPEYNFHDRWVYLVRRLRDMLEIVSPTQLGLTPERVRELTIAVVVKAASYYLSEARSGRPGGSAIEAEWADKLCQEWGIDYLEIGTTPEEMAALLDKARIERVRGPHLFFDMDSMEDPSPGEFVKQKRQVEEGEATWEEIGVTPEENQWYIDNWYYPQMGLNVERRKLVLSDSAVGCVLDKERKQC